MASMKPALRYRTADDAYKSFKQQVSYFERAINRLIEDLETNIVSAITDTIKTSNIINDINDELHRRLKTKLEANKFDTSGFLSYYINCVLYNISIDADFNITSEWNDDSFDRDRRIETNYQTANGNSASYSITSGEIIEMIDKGRNKFKITPHNSNTFIGKNGKVYTRIVYRAMENGGKKQRHTRRYNKKGNREKYDPYSKDYVVYTVLYGKAINVPYKPNRKDRSKFGFGLYDFITLCITEIEKEKFNGKTAIQHFTNKIEEMLKDDMHDIIKYYKTVKAEYKDYNEKVQLEQDAAEAEEVEGE